MLLVSPSYRTKTASSFYRGGNSLYIASKSAVSKIRSFVSPVINSLPNSSNRSVAIIAVTERLPVKAFLGKI